MARCIWLAGSGPEKLQVVERRFSHAWESLASGGCQEARASSWVKARWGAWADSLRTERGQVLEGGFGPRLKRELFAEGFSRRPAGMIFGQLGAEAKQAGRCDLAPVMCG